MVGNHTRYGRESADLLEQSGLDETTLRLAWLTNGNDTDYELTKKKAKILRELLYHARVSQI